MLDNARVQVSSRTEFARATAAPPPSSPPAAPSRTTPAAQQKTIACRTGAGRELPISPKGVDRCGAVDRFVGKDAVAPGWKATFPSPENTKVTTADVRTMTIAPQLNRYRKLDAPPTAAASYREQCNLSRNRRRHALPETMNQSPPKPVDDLRCTKRMRHFEKDMGSVHGRPF